MALRAKNRPDEAEDEDFGHSKARTTTKYGRFFAATRRDGANFPHFVVARRFSNPLQCAPRALNCEKLAPVAAV
jgi:hypothetical protein